MSLNHREIDAVIDELDISGAHIQKIRQPNYHSLHLELYRPGGRFGLLVCLAPGKTRLHLADKAPENEVKLQRFAQFLRSRFQGGRITGIEQINDDRIVRIGVIRGGEELELWIRLWSGASNIVASVKDGPVLDAYYRRPGRDEISGGNFALPEKKPGPPGEFTCREFPGKGSFNERVGRFYAEQEYGEVLASLKDRILKKLSSEEARTTSVIKKLSRKTDQYENYEGYKKTADLLLSSLHLIRPGSSSVTLQDYYNEGTDIEIELDPSLSPDKNAEKYYSRYRKAKSGLEKVMADLENYKLQLSALRHDRKLVESETDTGKLKDFLKSSPAGGSRGDKPDRPGLSYRSGPFTILVGRSSRENDELLRKHVRGNDIWLHTRDYPGGYVFIKTIKGKSVPLENLLDAGNLALFYSRGKSAGRGELYYTEVKYLRRTKDGKQGLVIPTQEKNLSIVLDDKRLEKLMNIED